VKTSRWRRSPLKPYLRVSSCADDVEAVYFSLKT
jgi:hypothetical protein